ncbi:RloB domain-containing protein [Corynebacterium flavescens]|uniref:RloB domain-containing protein n=1 Tax=Corynebacterium flavescens TaxID=28028 RepID=UPI003FD14C1D
MQSRGKRAGKGARKTKTSVLLLVEGDETEKGYFELLKLVKGWHTPGIGVPGIALSIKSSKQNAIIAMVREAKKAVIQDSRNVVFIVLDEDENLPSQFQEACSDILKWNDSKKEGSGRVYFALTSPQFEAWLIAHHRQIPESCDKHWVVKEEERLGILEATQRKHPSRRKRVPSSFPVANYPQAAENIEQIDLNEYGASNATAIPALIQAIDKIAGN